MSELLKEALGRLDPASETDWTADGLPLVSAVQDILGREVTRQEIVDADPELTRELAAKREMAAEQEEQTSTDEPTAEPTAEPTLDEQVKLLDDAISDLQQEIARLEHRVFVLSQQRGQLWKQKVARQSTAREQALGIRAYLDRCNRERQEKHDAAQALRAQGVRLKDLDPRSPLDSAMSRKNKRGTARPTS